MPLWLATYPPFSGGGLKRCLILFKIFLVSVRLSVVLSKEFH